jgi:hypothetical protein
VTPSSKRVVRLTSAWVRDQGMRPIVAAIVGGVIELRAKGRRKTEVVDIASLYLRAVRERVFSERQAAKVARRKPK